MIFTEKMNERELHKEQKLWILLVFPLLFFIYGVFYNYFYEAHSILYGLRPILASPTILMTDFIEVGGVGAAFINASLIGFFNLYLLKRYKLRINGLLIAAFMTVLGFSFFGKNVFNILPIYFGGFLYTRYQKIEMKQILLVTMFGTALAPIVSEIAFSGIISPRFSLIVAMAIGILIGFIIVPLSSHMLKFHDGYNLYNIGFTAGIIGTIFMSILKSFHVALAPENTLFTRHQISFTVLMVILFLFLIVVGLAVNPKLLKSYPQIFKYKGRTITDFTVRVGYGMTFFNMGVMGLSALLLVHLFGAVINGPIFAGIFTIVGFSAFGKHLKNCVPIVFGVLITAHLIGLDVASTPVMIAALFSTTIAPIAGTYGPIWGVVAGAFHLMLVTNIGVIHGGVNLYNNGFSGGLVAGFLVPIIDAFQKGDR